MDDDYMRELSMNYWAEEEEIKAGTHPSQIKERIEDQLSQYGIYEVTRMNYIPDSARVAYTAENETGDIKTGIYDYILNELDEGDDHFEEGIYWINH